MVEQILKEPKTAQTMVEQILKELDSALTMVQQISKEEGTKLGSDDGSLDFDG